MSPYSVKIWLAAAVICGGCNSGGVGRRAISDCVIGEYCAVSGQLIATEQKGRIQDETGCITVGLPDNVTDDWNLNSVSASGQVFGAPDIPGLVTFRIRDREFDAESCYDGTAMYVEEISRINHDD